MEITIPAAATTVIISHARHFKERGIMIKCVFGIFHVQNIPNRKGCNDCSTQPSHLLAPLFLNIALMFTRNAPFPVSNASMLVRNGL